jgi:hypothetical protein
MSSGVTRRHFLRQTFAFRSMAAFGSILGIVSAQPSRHFCRFELGNDVDIP